MRIQARTSAETHKKNAIPCGVYRMCEPPIAAPAERPIGYTARMAQTSHHTDGRHPGRGDATPVPEGTAGTGGASLRTPSSPVHAWLLLDDASLLAQCELDTYRASGPGGQKRNKTSSAVRLRHRPTGLIVTAVESRSQHENRARALRRLREAIALHERSPLRIADPPPSCVADAMARTPGLRVNPHNPDYPRIVQYVLDVLLTCRGSVSEAGGVLGLSTGQLVAFLRRDGQLWEQANRMRAEFGLHRLHES